MRILACLLLALLAGCATPPPADDKPGPTPSACAPTYPDGSPKDCATDLRVLATAPPGDGWRCMDFNEGGLNGWDPRVELWSDGQQWGMVHRRAAEAGLVVGEVRFGMDDGGSTGPFTWSGGDGKLAVLGAFPFEAGLWTYHLRAFRAEGNLSLEVRTSVFGDVAWYVYAADGATADGTFQAEVEGQEEGPWIPASTTFQGERGPVAVHSSTLAGRAVRHVAPLVTLPVETGGEC